LQYFRAVGVNPAADADQDGYSNAEEFTTGTSPVDANSFARILSVDVSGGDVVIRIQSVSGRNYQLQSRDSLAVGNWIDTGSPQAGSGGLLTFTVTGGATAEPSRLYRVRISM
jgi:hypothetical protein